MKPTLKNVTAAIELLTQCIGCYGKRMEDPLYICWGNGVILRDKTGMMISGGVENIARTLLVFRAELEIMKKLYKKGA